MVKKTIEWDEDEDLDNQIVDSLLKLIDSEESENDEDEDEDLNFGEGEFDEDLDTQEEPIDDLINEISSDLDEEEDEEDIFDGVPIKQEQKKSKSKKEINFDYPKVERDILRTLRISFHALWIIAILITTAMVVIPLNNVSILMKDDRVSLASSEGNFNDLGIYASFEIVIDNRMNIVFPINFESNIIIDLYGISGSKISLAEEKFTETIGNENKTIILSVSILMEDILEQLDMELIELEEIEDLFLNLEISLTIGYFIYSMQLITTAEMNFGGVLIVE